MTAPLTHIRRVFAPPVFADRDKTAKAAYSNLVGWGILVVAAPLLVVLGLVAPALQTMVWLVLGAMIVLAVLLLAATHAGFVKQGAAVFLIAVWGLYTWAAWESGGMFSASLCAQFIVVAIAEGTYGWRWAMAACALALATVSVFMWAEIIGIVPPSMVVTTPVSYGAVIGTFLIALALMHGLVGAQTRGTGARVARELKKRTLAEQRLVSLVDNAPFGAFVCELDGSDRLVVTRANQHASVALGTDASKFVGGDVGAAFAAATMEDLVERFLRVAHCGDAFEQEETHVHSGGSKRTLDVHAYRTEPGEIAIFFSDVTQQRVAEARIRRMAYHDELTSLPNRKLLLDRMNMAMEAARRRGCGVALLFIDLDNFKPLNDRYGHAFGDAVLAAVARRLVHNARASDTVARLGGDEFAMLVPDVSSGEQAELVAKKMVDAFCEPFGVNGRSVTLSASIGVTLSAEHDCAPLDLLDLADKAMYETKRGGNGGYRVA